MPISMNQSARYVTQQKLWDVPLLGPLTDRKIAKYQKMGKYDGVAREVERRNPKKSQARKLRKALFDGLHV